MVYKLQASSFEGHEINATIFINLSFREMRVTKKESD